MDSSIVDLLNDVTVPGTSETTATFDIDKTSLPSSVVFSWCEKCFKQAQDMEMKHKKSISIIKKKIIFTDDLIGMYTDVKSALEQAQNQIKSLEKECKRRENDNQLISKQLKALLAERNSSELEVQKEETQSLKSVVENLKDRIMSFEMTRKMLEDKIESLKEEQSQKDVDWKKHSKEKSLLQKDVARLKKQITSLEKDNTALTKKNQFLQEGLRRRRSRGSGSFSQNTDSEHNNSGPLEEIKTEEEETKLTPTVFKSPLPNRKKKLKRRRRKSHVASVSDEDESAAVVQDDAINEAQILPSGEQPMPDNEQLAISNNEEPVVPNNLESPAVSNNKLSLSPAKEATQKDSAGHAKANWLSSASDTASDAVKPLLATKDMKTRLLETKKKRAYRSFCSHPSTTQLKDLTNIVHRMNNEKDFTVREEIIEFCKKNLLSGHESYVVKKIEKLHKNSLSKEMLDRLGELSFENDDDRSKSNSKPTETPKKTPVEMNVSLKSSSDDFVAVTDHAHPSFSQSIELPPTSSLTQKVNASQKDDVSVTDTNNNHSISLQENSKELPVAQVLSAKIQTIPARVGKPVSENSGTNQNIEKANKIDKNNSVTSKNLEKPFFSLFSSDDTEDEQVRVKIHSVNDTQKSREENSAVSFEIPGPPANSVDETEIEDYAVNNDKSKNKHLQTDAKVSKPKFDKSPLAVAPVAPLIPSSVSEFSDSESDDVSISDIQKRKRIARGQEAAKDLNPKSASKTIQTSNTTKNVQSIETSSPAPKQNIDRKVLTKENVTVSKNLEVAAIKRNHTASTPEIPSKIAKLNEASGIEVIESGFDSKSNHRILASLQSLPFSIDSDSVRISPKIDTEPSYSFLPTTVSDDEMSDNSLSPIETEKFANKVESLMSPSNIDNILSDMAMLGSMEHLSPLRDTNPNFSVLPDFDDDNRVSISPSADLCTAISFSASAIDVRPKDKLATFSSSEEEPPVSSESTHMKETLQLPPLSDAPRRFSCEAPMLARTVPTVKRVCKARSLDPAAVKSSDSLQNSFQVGDKSSATSFISVQSDTNTSKIRPSSVKIVTPAYSGPFKVVGSPVTSPTEKLAKTAPASSEKASTSQNQRAEAPLPQDPLGSHDISLNVEQPSTSVSEEANPIQVDIASTRKQAKSPLPCSGEQIFKKVASESDRLVDSSHKPVDSPLTDILQEIHSYAVVVYPEKTYATLSQPTVFKWLMSVIQMSCEHVTHESVKKFASSTADLTSIEAQHILHNAEYQFVKMIAAVDIVRSECDKTVIRSVILPSILKLLCKYGYAVYRTSAIILCDDSISTSIGNLISRDKSKSGPTSVLIRLLATFSRSVGFAKAALDFCRYAAILKPLTSIELLLYDCIVCYPEAFSKSFPLTGKILIHSLSSLAEAYRHEAKTDQFKEDIRYRARQLEILLGFGGATEYSLEVGKDEKWRPIFDQCMLAIFTAKLVPCAGIKNSQSSYEVLALGIDNINDVFSALEFLSSIKSLPFVAGEIIDKKFWPWLNAWSRHLATAASEDSKTVSDACIIAVLRGISVILTAVSLRQKARHPSQSVSNHVLAYYNTLCALLSNFTLRHVKTAPFRVQCATAVTVLRLAFCNPIAAYSNLYDWLTATMTLFSDENENNKESRKAHPLLPHMAALHSEKLMRKSVTWLEAQTKLQRRNKNFAATSLTVVIWG